ncbi:MAG TPA: hypothetical protein VNF05_03135 [Acidimicrobiales bacterium]|nr:hypothetical protein [Acidimicrobiales bacterium]
MASVKELFDVVTEHLVATDERVEAGKILHSEGLKSGGKFFAFTRHGELVVKLPRERVTQLIAEGTGSPFDAGKGRPMREWVVLRPTDLASCTGHVAEALEFVAGEQ